MLTTKQFADLCSTTKKTIIHYDKVGLIKPSSYHQTLHNSFRIYEPKQVLIYQKIYLLKSFGLSLSQIKERISDKNCFTKTFQERQNDLLKEKEKIEAKLKKINEYLQNLKTGKTLVSPKIKKVKQYYIYAIERKGRYVDIENFDKELESLIHDNYKHPYVTIFKTTTFSPQEDQMIIGAVIGSKKPKEIKGVKIVKIEGYKALSCLHIGSYSYLSFIWQFMDKYIKDHHLKRNPQNTCREFYLKGGLVEPNEDNLITELQIPLI